MAIQKPTNGTEVILLSFAAIIVILVLYLSALAIYDLVNKEGDTASEMTHVEPQKGYFAVSEWGIQLKTPDTVTDVRYKIVEGRDSVIFAAKPKGMNVEFVSEFDGDFVTYSRVQLYRTTEKSIADKHGYFEKIGEYYYVIFSSPSYTGIFGEYDVAGEYENTVTADLIEMLNTAKSLK